MSQSVLNYYHYFNKKSDTDSTQEINNGVKGSEEKLIENCVAHTDPGLLTVLCRGTTPGLEVLERSAEEAKPCCEGASAFHETDPLGDGKDGMEVVGDKREWTVLEPIMKDNQVVVLVGETLSRVTNGAYPACLHRVSEGDTTRINIAYELRPVVSIFCPWGSPEERESRPK
eukprot:m.67055 g.67055  ORF g.67055 m.67055 type:complete len:172 (-) comp11855_c0_seq1:279-794(-)